MAFLFWACYFETSGAKWSCATFGCVTSKAKIAHLTSCNASSRNQSPALALGGLDQAEGSDSGTAAQTQHKTVFRLRKVDGNIKTNKGKQNAVCSWGWGILGRTAKVEKHHLAGCLHTGKAFSHPSLKSLPSPAYISQLKNERSLLSALTGEEIGAAAPHGKGVASWTRQTPEDTVCTLCHRLITVWPLMAVSSQLLCCSFAKAFCSPWEIQSAGRRDAPKQVSLPVFSSQTTSSWSHPQLLVHQCWAEQLQVFLSLSATSFWDEQQLCHDQAGQIFLFHL